MVSLFRTYIILVSLSLSSVTKSAAQNSNLPDGRVSAHLVYHPSSRAMLLVDGYQVHSDSTRNDVWKWDGKKWQRIIAYGPGTRSLTGCALNCKTGNIETFAGIGNRNYDTKRSDTWSFDGIGWTVVHTNVIGTRDHHKMVYADHLNAFVIYGGLDDTRQYDTVTWMRTDKEYEPLDIQGPGMRYHFGMAYDKKRKRVVLYGGGAGHQRDELWEFDGSRWHQIEQGESPGPKLRASLVYSEDTGMVILHGGDDEGITWGWDGKRWKKVAFNGPPGQLIALGYDPQRKVVLAFGGTRDGTFSSALWELRDSNWRLLATNGVWKWDDDKPVWREK